MRRLVLAVMMLAAVGCVAQDAMPMDGMPMGAAVITPAEKKLDTGMYLMRVASGTSMNAAAAEMPMRMMQAGSWKWMLMGQAFAVETQQTGPRGRDKLYSVNWMMAATEHKWAGGTLMLQTMLSLEPATITGREYPELFQTGETAYGAAIVDGQHPHNFVMGVGAQYAHAVGERGVVEMYYAPVGDPALGPVAFPHRASAMDLPQAPIGHHWEDSTHIAANVATAAAQAGWVRVEASGFYGTEPGENRWTIGWGPMNSWATRVSVMPTGRWMVQGSAGRLARPERFTAGDVVRATGSVEYSRPMSAGKVWSSSAVWGRNHETATGRNLNAELVESVLPLTKRDAVTGRAERVAKDDLFADTPTIAQQLAATVGSVFTVTAYTVGYTREIGRVDAVGFAVGANVSAYGVPAAIQTYYGARSVGVDLYLRMRLER